AFYHTTRICLNLPFITSVRQVPAVPDGEAEDPSNPIVKSLKICQSSAQSIVDILQRYRSQHTLGNTPLNFVGAAIVAINAVLATTRLQASPPPSMRDTMLPFLDAALEDMSASWKLAGEARQKVRNAFALTQQQQQQQQQQRRRHPQSPARPRHPDRGVADDGKASAHDQTPAVKDAAEPQVGAGPPLAEPAQEQLRREGPPGSKLASPEQNVWDPMSLLDSEAAYWGNCNRNDMFTGWDPDFVSGMADSEWLNQPHVPE
ncbi:hypothetical protein LX36DRAFT_675770, partial [Colletotrichum falcatum]